MTRRCKKTGCPAPATATLSFEYGSRTAWLGDLTPDPVPAHYDLCAEHAERFSVPRGWDRVDRRSSTPPLHVLRPMDLERYEAV